MPLNPDDSSNPPGFVRKSDSFSRSRLAPSATRAAASAKREHNDGALTCDQTSKKTIPFHDEDLQAAEPKRRQDYVQCSTGNTSKRRKKQENPSSQSVRFASDFVDGSGECTMALTFTQPGRTEARVPMYSRVPKISAVPLTSKARKPTQKYTADIPVGGMARSTHRQQYRSSTTVDRQQSLGADLHVSKRDWKALREDVESVELELPLYEQTVGETQSRAGELETGVPKDQIPEPVEAPKQPEFMMNMSQVKSRGSLRDTKKVAPKISQRGTPLEDWMKEFWKQWFLPEGYRLPRSSEEFVRIFGEVLS